MPALIALESQNGLFRPADRWIISQIIKQRSGLAKEANMMRLKVTIIVDLIFIKNKCSPGKTSTNERAIDEVGVPER